MAAYPFLPPRPRARCFLLRSAGDRGPQTFPGVGAEAATPPSVARCEPLGSSVFSPARLLWLPDLISCFHTKVRAGRERPSRPVTLPCCSVSQVYWEGSFEFRLSGEGLPGRLD